MSGSQATASHDPGVGFWLRYAEAEGALSEDQGEQALVVLPESLQQRFALDDVVAVTADPEVAREDGALLLLPGHPALDGAATLAVQQGDAGTAWLPWPDRRPPRTSELLERAREAVAVEHGRLDRDRDAARAWLPVLRVGALATTTASLDLRFQERHEVWVDARTGTEVSDALLEVLTGSSWSHEPGQRHAVLAVDLARSVAAADRLLSDRAAERADALSARAGDDRRDALARVTAYYDKALTTIRRRRAAADDERRALLDAQAEATQLERERRCQEVEETHRVRFELQPFRLHLVMVPSLRLPLRVRRGAATYPLELVWMLPTRTFAPVACPHCGRESALVAGRKRLGCTGCLPRPVPTADGDHDAARDAQSEPVAPDAEPGSGADDAGAPTPSQGNGRPATAPARRSAGGTAPARRSAGASATPRRSAGGTEPPRRSAGASASPRRSAGGTEPPRRSAGASASPRARARHSAERVQVVGDRLALRFWDEVAQGRRWHRRRVAADSPLTTLHRLYGKTAPLVAVGVHPGDSPESVLAYTQAPEPGLPCVTHGELRSGQAAWTFTLRWEPASSGPVLLELLPGLPMLDGHLPTPWALGREVAQRLFGPADPPIALDPVAEALWRAGRPVGGLPLVVRCLTAWWRSTEELDVDAAPAVLAAALSSLVENRSGLRRSRAEAAMDHGVSVEEVTVAAQRLQRRLELSSQRPW